MRLNKQTVFVTLLLTAASSNILADEQELTEQLMDMDLGQLLDVSITVASKKEESILDTPSSVTVFRDSEINQYGFYTLRELAEITPGYSTARIVPQTRLETRGGNNTNLKHLVLIDDIPVNATFDYAASLDNLLPVHWASQVEFLRGPASALYGISAFNGVLNIRDDNGLEEGFNSANKLSLGSDDDLFRYLSKHTYQNENGEFRFSISYYNKDNSNRPVSGPLPILPGTEDTRLKDGEHSAFTYFNYKGTEGPLNGFTMGLISFRRENGGAAGLFRPFNETSDSTREVRSQFIPYIKYETKVDDWSFKSYYKYDYSKFFLFQFNDGDIPAVGVPLPLPSDPSFTTPIGTVISRRDQLARFSADSHKLNFEANYNKEGFGHIIAGIDWSSSGAIAKKTFQVFDGLLDIPPVPVVLPAGLQLTIPVIPTTPVLNDGEETLSVYTQYLKDFDHLDKLRLTLGVRVDTVKIGDFVDFSETSPRIALVQRFADNWSVKAMYGFALRAPNLLEVNQNNVLAQDPNTDPSLLAQVTDVVPETIKVYETALQYNSDQFFASFTYYDNEINHAISSVLRPADNALYYVNEDGSSKAKGIEAEVRYEGGNYRLIANYSTRNTKEEDGSETPAVPDRQFTLVGSYFFDTAYPTTVTSIVKHIDSFTPETPFSQNTNDGFTIVDFKVMTRFSDEYGVELKLSNLFDESLYAYEDNPLIGTENAFVNLSEFEAILSFNYFY